MSNLPRLTTITLTAEERRWLSVAFKAYVEGAVFSPEVRVVIDSLRKKVAL